MIGRLLRLGRRTARHRAHELLEKFDLAGRRLIGETWSGGMPHALTSPPASLSGRPSCSLTSRRPGWTRVAGRFVGGGGDLAASGTTILLTTQYLEEADRLAHVALLDGGRIVAEGAPSELKSRVSGRRLDLVFPDGGAFDARPDFSTAESSGRMKGCGRSASERAVQARSMRSSTSSPGEVPVYSLSVTTATLDDVFLALTGRSSHPEEVISHV